MADRRSAQDTVCLAVGLGWLLAELYDIRRLPAEARPKFPQADYPMRLTRW
jgi:hypothetical protein